jgi:CHC2 zinc finger
LSCPLMLSPPYVVALSPYVVARAAIVHNPAIAALYRRLKAKGKRGDVAMGQCMRKLLHLVYAVWQTNRPFDHKHFAWETPGASAKTEPRAEAFAASHDQTPSVVTSASPAVANAGSEHQADNSAAPPTGKETAVGHKRDLPAIEVVTTATATVAPTPASVKPVSVADRAARPKVDFAFLRQQVSMEQVLQQLGLSHTLRGRGLQRRGPCPIHSQPNEKKATFSAHLGKHLFQCFDAECRAQGNVLDLWAAVHRLPLYEAALHLAQTFQLPRNREEEPVGGTR